MLTRLQIETSGRLISQLRDLIKEEVDIPECDRFSHDDDDSDPADCLWCLVAEHLHELKLALQEIDDARREDLTKRRSRR